MVSNIYTVKFKLANLKQIKVSENNILLVISWVKYVTKEQKILSLLDPEEIDVFNMQTPNNSNSIDEITLSFCKRSNYTRILW